MKMLMKLKIVISLVMLGLFGCFHARGQEAAIKTNILNDALLSPNIGAEFGLAPKWTIEADGQLNAWKVGGHSWRHWLVMPEGRYWFCQRFAGHFVGAHLLGGQYNFGQFDFPVSFLGTDYRVFKDYRHQGWFGGAGIAYGYSWILDRRWNLEAEIGIGWVYTRYDVYRCADCGKKVDSNRHHNYFGPTKAAISLVYTF